MIPVSLVVVVSAQRISAGETLAERFGAPLVQAEEVEPGKLKSIEKFLRSTTLSAETGPAYALIVSEGPLALIQLSKTACLSISADFCGATLNYRREKGGGKNQSLAKAVGAGAGAPLRVIDATAGLGRDAFILASLGCRVQMWERHPVVWSLLQSGMASALDSGAGFSPAFRQTLDCLSLKSGDAVSALQSLPPTDLPDVIYLDPMFPPRRKSALVKKEMRVFHDLVGNDADTPRLFEAAWSSGTKRIVVKRPRTAPMLTEQRPTYVLEGKSNRYDIYVRGPIL